jgi:hypothetical protein
MLGWAEAEVEANPTFVKILSSNVLSIKALNFIMQTPSPFGNYGG